MTSIAGKVRDKIAGFGKNVLFTSRDLLDCGRRNPVDIELCRLVQSGRILRLTAGLFMRVAEGLQLPSKLDIARVKALRFSRRLYEAEKSGQQSSAESNHTFHTDGSSTSMLTVFGRIFLKHRSPGRAAAQVGGKPEAASCRTGSACGKPEMDRTAENCRPAIRWPYAGLHLTPLPFSTRCFSENLLSGRLVCRICGSADFLSAGRISAEHHYHLRL